MSTRSELRCAPLFVLSHTDYRERDLIIRAAVEDQGLCAFIAKGARGSRKRFAGALDVLVASTCTYSSSDSGLGKITEAARLPGPEPDPSDITAFGVRCYCAELLLGTVQENFPTRYPFRLMFWVHQALSESVSREHKKMRAFWVLNRIRVIGLHREGRLPDLQNCSDCSRAFSLEEPLSFTRDRGILCLQCEGAGGGRTMRAGHLLELQELYSGSPFVGEWGSQELSSWLEEQVRETVGKPMSSSRILETLSPPGSMLNPQ